MPYQEFKDGKLTETNVPATVTEALMNELWDILADVEVKARMKQQSRNFPAMIGKYVNLKNRTCGILHQEDVKNIDPKTDPLVATEIVRQYLIKLQDIGLYSIRSEEVIF